MDHLETLLRKEFEHEAGPATAVGAHDVRELIGLIRARRRRRAMATTTFVMMLVIVTVGVAARQLAVSRAVDPALRPTASPTDSAGTGISWAGIVGGAPVAPTSGDFADASHGYLLVARCDQTGSKLCQAGLEVTADGGATWTARELPAQPFQLDTSQRPGYSAQIYALASQTVVYDRPDAGRTPHRRFITTDAGLHWRELAITPGPVTAEMPPDCRPGLFEMMLNGQSGPTVGCLTSDGTALPLATPPATATSTSRLIRATDGSVWVDTRSARHTSGGYGPDLWVSHDAGRTWQPAATPFAAPTEDQAADGQLFTADGHTAYYLAFDTVGPTRAVRLYRSHNAGASWNLIDTRGVAPSINETNLAVYAAGYPGGPDAMDTSAAAVPDGGLVLTWFGRALRVTADGPVESVLGVPGLSVFNVGSAAIGVSTHGPAPRTASAFSLTHDGTSWTAMTLP